MLEEYHIDLSNKLGKSKSTGIACLAIISGKHKGCVLTGKFKKELRRRIFSGDNTSDNARLYSICIYYLIADSVADISRLIICNDENFEYVRKNLLMLLSNVKFDIIVIFEFRKSFGRNIKSSADNLARAYAKRGMKINQINCGKRLNVVKITFDMIKSKWEEIDKKRK